VSKINGQMKVRSGTAWQQWHHTIVQCRYHRPLNRRGAHLAVLMLHLEGKAVPLLLLWVSSAQARS
jgi:hypothetical protein